MVLLLVSLGVLFFSLGQIWFCQIVVYPLFARVGAEEYVGYHRFYGRRIPGPVIVPGFASFLLPMALWWTPPPGSPPSIAALNAACGAVGLVLTVALLIPRHARLERRGKDERVIAELVRYNWPRTLSITASAALTMVMLLRAMPEPALGSPSPEASPRCPERVQTRLYFGLSGPGGPIPEGDWDAFLADTITPRFPGGLTVLEALGQWRGADHTVSRERTRLVEIMHEASPAAQSAIDEIAATYKTRHGQEAVMVVHSRSPVCLH